MPLSLVEAYVVLRKIVEKPSYVRDLGDGSIMIWFFDSTPLANNKCEIVLQYDGSELTLTKVEWLQYHDSTKPPAMRNISRTWQSDDVVRSLVKKRVKAVRNALKLA